MFDIVCASIKTEAVEIVVQKQGDDENITSQQCMQLA